VGGRDGRRWFGRRGMAPWMERGGAETRSPRRTDGAGPKWSGGKVGRGARGPVATVEETVRQLTMGPRGGLRLEVMGA
jgi:hypothetical protein